MTLSTASADAFLSLALSAGTPLLWLTDRCAPLRPAVEDAGGRAECIEPLSPFFRSADIRRDDGTLDPHLATLSLAAIELFPGGDAWSGAMLATSHAPVGAGLQAAPAVPAMPALGACARDVGEILWWPPVAVVCLCQVPDAFRASTVLRLVGTVWLEFRGMTTRQLIVLENLWQYLETPETRALLRYLDRPWLGPNVETLLASSREAALTPPPLPSLEPSTPTPF